MIRNWLAGFYFYADDTLSSPGLSMLLALDFLTVFSELDQLFTRHGVHGLHQLRAKEAGLRKLAAFILQIPFLKRRISPLLPAFPPVRGDRPCPTCIGY